MNINDEIKLIHITSKEQLLKHYDGISELFAKCFGKPLERSLWDWAYIDNPFGTPLVAIALYQGQLVGHYAVIPMNMENGSDRFIGFLAMTTMVASDFRAHKLFQRLAELVYEHIKSVGVPAIVFGFPNSNAAPGLIKRLGWTIEDYKVISVTPQQLKEVGSLLNVLLAEDAYTLNLENQLTKDWRTSKPNQSWSYKNALGLKPIGNDFDLMHITNTQQLLKTKFNSSINMLLPATTTLQLDSISSSFPYRFGYRLFNTEKKPNLFIQMSMSDVF